MRSSKILAYLSGAEGVREAISKDTCVMQSGIEMSYSSIKSNIADSLNLVVQIERRPGKRYVSEVIEIHGYDPRADRYTFNSLFLRGIIADTT